MNSDNFEKEKKTNSNLFSKAFWIGIILWICLFSVGFFAYWRALPSFHIKPENLTQKDYFKPEWHAGKLGEAFANQLFKDGKCHFYASSRLNFTPPKDFFLWKEINTEIELPSKSYFLLFFEKPDSLDEYGIKISRNNYYHNGLLLFYDHLVKKKEFLTEDNRKLPKKLSIKLTRKDENLSLFINNQLFGKWFLKNSADYRKIAFISGPTGVTLDKVSINGYLQNKIPAKFDEDFEFHSNKILFLPFWLKNLVWAAGFFILICLILFTTEQYQKYITFRLISFMILSWLCWGINGITHNQFINVFVIIIEIVVLLIGFVLIRKSIMSSSYYKPFFKHPIISRKFGQILRILLLVIAITGSIREIILIEQTRLQKVTVKPIKIKLHHPRGIKLGRKLLITKEGSDFQWNCKLGLRKNSITELVMRKHIGKGTSKNEVSWYSLTLSRDKAHKSGLYFTKNDYQILLKAIELNSDNIKNVNVSIRLQKNRFFIKVNGKTISTTDDNLEKGEVSIVPITNRVKLFRNNFKSLRRNSDLTSCIISSYPNILIWLFIFFIGSWKWERKKRIRTTFQQTIGIFLIILPILGAIIYNSFTGLHIISLMVYGTSFTILLLFIFVILTDPKRHFFSFTEILFLLLCFESILRVGELSSNLQENPIQSNIPPHLYWYQAASSRRWNSFIMFNQFRNGNFTAHLRPKVRHKMIRILCIGSSSTAGGYPQYIETSFLKQGMNKVQVIDGGVPGTTTVNLVNFYKNLLYRFKPDIVTFCLIRNDIKFLANLQAQRIFELETSKKGFSPLRSKMYYLLNKSVLYRFYRYNLIQGLLKLELFKEKNHDKDNKLNKTLQNALNLYEKNVRDFVKTAQKKSELPVLLVEPFYESDGYDILPEERRTKSIEVLYKLSRELNVPIIDLELFVENHRDDLLFIDDVHHYDQGKRLLGSFIQKELYKYIVSYKKQHNYLPLHPPKNPRLKMEKKL